MFSKTRVILAAGVALLLVGVGVASADLPDGNKVNACFKAVPSSDYRVVRLLDVSAGETCAHVFGKNWHKFSFSVQGPPGVQGPKGDDGAKGAKGDDGAKGAKGDTGAPGKDGKDGKNGKDGKDGATGPTGAKGADGAPGKDGADGKDGLGNASVELCKPKAGAVTVPPCNPNDTPIHAVIIDPWTGN